MTNKEKTEIKKVAKDVMLRAVIHNNGYVYNRIDKRVARRLYNEGYIIAILGSKQRITGVMQICKEF